MPGEELGTYNDETGQRERRPVVFPTVVIPLRVMYLTSTALVGAALLAMVASLIRAVAYSNPNPSGLIGSGLDASMPTLSLADRLSIFTSDGAGIVVAILIALAAALAAIAVRTHDDADSVGSVILVVASLAAVVIIAVNAIMFVDVLANTQGIFLESETATKASSVLGHLEPMLLAVGVILYSASRFRDDGDESATGEPPEEPSRG